MTVASTSPPRPRKVALIIAAACLVPAALDGCQTYLQGRLARAPGVPWRQIAFQSGEWVILGALTSLIYVLAVRFPLRGARVRRNVAMHLFGALILCGGWASLGVVLRASLGLLPQQLPLSRYAVSWLLTTLPWSVFVYFAVLGCVLAFTYFFEAKEREAVAARLTAQVAEARLGALRMQLRPHFLFNSLNAIAVLVRDRRNDDAALVVEQLSGVLRDVLRDGAHEIPLESEMSFLRKYLAIEQVRFSDRLSVEWDVMPGTEPVLVPSFVLQPLVENAIRHGVAARSEPTTVRIASRIDGGSLVLTVANDCEGAGGWRPQRERSVGLANTVERLATLYGDAAHLQLETTAGRVTATVHLPMRIPAAPNAEAR